LRPIFSEGGFFVVRAFVPTHLLDVRDEQDSSRRASLSTRSASTSPAAPSSSSCTRAIVSLTASGTRLYPIVTRYVWPSELDLMARIAGLSLHERWADWGREPATAPIPWHVSVYRW
jgi:hypothetical protein